MNEVTREMEWYGMVRNISEDIISVENKNKIENVTND
jgi:hypothetical protein